MKTPWEGAQTSICCAVDEALPDQTGLYYADCQVCTRRIASFYRAGMINKMCCVFAGDLKTFLAWQNNDTANLIVVYAISDALIYCIHYPMKEVPRI